MHAIAKPAPGNKGRSTNLSRLAWRQVWICLVLLCWLAPSLTVAALYSPSPAEPTIVVQPIEADSTAQVAPATSAGERVLSSMLLGALALFGLRRVREALRVNHDVVSDYNTTK